MHIGAAKQDMARVGSDSKGTVGGWENEAAISEGNAGGNRLDTAMSKGD